MAEDLQGGICGENNNKWWSIDSTRSIFPSPPPLTSSSSSSSSRSCGAVDETNNKNNNINMVSDSYHHQLGFPDEHKSQMMGYGLASSTSPNWDHHSLFSGCNERADENNFNSVVEEETGIDILKKPMMNQELSSMSNCIISSTIGLWNGGLQIGSGSPYVCPSTTLIQQAGLYDEPDPQLQIHPLFTNHRSSMSSPIWSKPLSSLEKQPPPIGLHFSNNTPFWNASADALHDIRAGAFASSSPSPNRPTFLLNKCTQLKSEESDLESAKKNNVSEGAFKRPRIETPSPLPTFKVRKEKLGDRVTALQQLVSPFGKTDTASVLHEAIEYIKFLHDQVSVLSTPYMKSGAPIQRHQGCDDTKVESSSSSSSEGGKQDLRSRGLCLVPISSTFPVATETSADFWTPSLSFGGGSLLR